ncbi:beta-L-arabinofuranosidase domain-containing protein [Mucilaginibacter sp.]|uniref:glycoside hydrolase family 127 protein n=1 Tax=Mucilaginibacter sp. TaxID=1882438 RepID=UPI0025E2F4A3|nr:beta-L-arabinofuranosidase domain-containing protein [Mucilaginibacter sp.]
MVLKKILLCAVFAGACLFCTRLSAQNKNSPVDNVLTPSPAVALNGYLGNKLSASLNNRIMAQDADRLIEPFKLKNRTETHLWQNEFWGKWFTSAVLAYKYQPSPELKKVLDHSVSSLLATQTPDGYIGNYAAAHRLEEWDIWGRKYCMLGLLSYYDLTGDKKSLSGAIRLADNLISDLNKKDGIIVTKGNFRGMAASSVLEPICLLYKATHNQKYLDFAKEIVRQWETPDGPQLISKANVNVGARFPKPKNWYSPEQGQKAYEMMSCYEGLTELYRLTGNETYKKAVMDAWENIRDTEINIVGSGASIEMWFGGNVVQDRPVTHYQETCVTVTWLKLTGQLLRLTGDSKYADEAERTYYNALLSSMSADGAVWAKYTPLNGQRLPGSEQCGMGLNCCEANGPRGLFNIPAYMVTSRKEGLQVNYFSDGVFKLKSPQGDSVVLTQHTAYPKSGTVEMDITLQQQQNMEIFVRIPAWSKNTKLSVNGEIVNDVQAGRYTSIKRTWKTGDKIIVDFDMRGRVIEMGTTTRSAAIMRGPIVLARDSRFEDAGLEAALKPVTDENGYIELVEDLTKADDVYMAFKASFIPESYTESPGGPISITLCDYASAGNGKQPSFYKVWGAQLVNKAGE